MCGIAGLLHVDGTPIDTRLLQSMTDALAHRGPDGDGLFVEGPVGLGHRRLAIIDLSTGDQPMLTEDRSLAIVFNGEIYNFRELRRDLEAAGHTFRTVSDTEVILRAYQAYGLECVHRLRGMFTFALWDARQRRLLLARDRVGIKPLVYSWDGRTLRFASEIKALLADPSLERTLDRDALADYLTFLAVPSPRTIFREIRKLPPASYLVIDFLRGEPQVRSYWDLRFAPDPKPSEAEWLEGLRWHLQDAVTSHLVSDVPIGAFLSGGMDSSTVVALMAKASPGRVRTFSIGFDEADFDELAYARSVARRYGTDHYEFVVKPDALEALPRLAAAFDEPFADSSALPSYYVAKITREHVTVALSGDGGDEGFAGYTRYAQADRLHRLLDRGPLSLARPLLRLGARLMPSGMRGRGSLTLFGAPPLDRYFQMMTFQNAATLRRLIAPEARPAEIAGGWSQDLLGRVAASGAADHVATLQYLDVQRYLPDDILTKVDRTSMMVSLEARVPLLDHVLLEFLATMPTSLKLAHGAGKAILKRAMEPDLPAEVLHRRKMGFGVPLGTWFRRELADYVRDVLLDRRTRERGLVDAPAVAAILAEHHSGRRDRSGIIWSLLCLEEWARRWMDRR